MAALPVGAQITIFLPIFLKLSTSPTINVLFPEPGPPVIIEKDCFQVLEQEKMFQDKFDLIFIDPPYKEKKINLILKNIFKNKILKYNGIIILHRHKNDDVKIEKDINIIESRLYGISKIIFCN